jgi:hypothetical protein
MLKFNRSVILVLIAFFSVSMFWASTAMADRLEKVDICHYDAEYDYWKLINVSGNAVPSHYANHDDGLPGGSTSQTGTLLDENCEPAVTACGDCLTGPGPGCEVEACEATICGIDPFCCDVAWDSFCVDEAADLCVPDLCTP